MWGGGSGENTAKSLENAAEQSTPAAAEVLENAADAARDQGADVNGIAQQALQDAGNAQAAGVVPGQPATPSLQAEPN